VVHEAADIAAVRWVDDGPQSATGVEVFAQDEDVVADGLYAPCRPPLACFSLGHDLAGVEADEVARADVGIAEEAEAATVAKGADREGQSYGGRKPTWAKESSGRTSGLPGRCDFGSWPSTSTLTSTRIEGDVAVERLGPAGLAHCRNSLCSG
jgi:hypothetical protein